MNSQAPNISCAVELPSYFYIPNDLYYSFGPQLAKEIRTAGGMEAINEALYELPTAEQVYSSEKYFAKEIYEDVPIGELVLEGWSKIDDGTIDALDIVYLTQPFLGRQVAVAAGIGIGGGTWIDYIDQNDNLLMTVKISGDNYEDLLEIFEAFANAIFLQDRFTEAEEKYSGFFGITQNNTEAWIGVDGEFVRIVISSTPNVIEDLYDSDQLLNY